MVGYIFLSNRARWWEKKLNIIITTKFKEYCAICCIYYAYTSWCGFRISFNY